MLTIKVLGGGCNRCRQVEQYAKEALETVATEINPDMEAAVVHISDPEQYARYGIMFTPGLVINERLVSAGRVPSLEEISKWIREALGPHSK